MYGEYRIIQIKEWGGGGGVSLWGWCFLGVGFYGLGVEF